MNKIFPQIEIEDNIFEVDISSSDIEIDPSEIGTEIGYNNGEIPAHFWEMIEEIIYEVPNRCEIKSGYTILPFNYSRESKNQLTIGGVEFYTDIIITSQLKKSEQAIIFLCSIGSKMEEWTKELHNAGDSVKSYLVNNVASVVVEEVADLLNNHINMLMKEIEINITNRYSPGYCNWSVAEQSKLFSFLPSKFCGVKLSDSKLMTPIKSISGIIGIGEQVEYKEYLCNTCGIKDCTHRTYISKKYNVNT